MIQEIAKDKFATLRRQAEEVLRGQPANLADQSAAEVQALIHNLQVHQIELELQNEELRRAQLDLQAARDRYADLYNLAPVGYFTLDANGAIVEANLTGAALLKVTRSSLIGAPLSRFVAKEDRERYAVYRVGLGAREEPQTTEVRLTRQAGAQFYARLEGLATHDHEGRLLQCKLTVSDISERVRAEEALRESERLTHSALNALSANICILDETGTILAVNQAWRDFAEANQAKGQAQYYEGFNYLAVCGSAMGPDAVEALSFAAGIKSIIKGERDRFELEYPCHSLSEQRWFVGRVTRFKGQGPIRVVVAHSNITERKRAEEILLRASRMEATATLAGGIAHDVNNLMTTVLGNAELLILDLNQPKALELLATISRSARRAGELAQQMLAFARGGKYQPRLMNLNDAIQQALQLQRDVIPDKLIVERQLASDLWSVAADASQISQVMVNLLANAVEASDSRGRIRISTANLVIDEPWTRSHPAEGIRNLKPGKYVNMVVDDMGQGMSAEVLAKVFEPFFTTKFQGRGMGLAAVYGIVQNHGGDISIESEAGHGTVVKVYLPAIE